MLATRVEAENFLVLDFVPNVVDYLMCAWIKPQFFSREYISRHYSNIGEFFVEAINHGAYIFTVINQQYILSEMKGSDVGWSPHEFLIYGYDTDKNTFNAADFTFRDKYSFEEVNIDLVCKGYDDIGVKHDYIAHRREGVALLTFNENTKYYFDRILVKENISNYLEGVGVSYITRMMLPDNTHMCNNDSGCTGIDAYEMLYEHLRALRTSDDGFDWRVPHVVYDHKVLMSARISFMNSIGIADFSGILSEFAQIRDRAHRLRNLYLKIFISEKMDSITDAINGYKDMCEKERVLLSRVYDALR
jgi:hypothetical protein